MVYFSGPFASSRFLSCLGCSPSTVATSWFQGKVVTTRASSPVRSHEVPLTTSLEVVSHSHRVGASGPLSVSGLDGHRVGAVWRVFPTPGVRGHRRCGNHRVGVHRCENHRVGVHIS